MRKHVAPGFVWCGKIRLGRAVVLVNRIEGKVVWLLEAKALLWLGRSRRQLRPPLTFLESSLFKGMCPLSGFGGKPLIRVILERATATHLAPRSFLKASSWFAGSITACCGDVEAVTLDQSGVASCSAVMVASGEVGLRLRFGGRCHHTCSRGPRASPCLCGVKALEEVPTVMTRDGCSVTGPWSAQAQRLSLARFVA